jgi:hypothetical protein
MGNGSLHSPLPNRRGVELKFLKDLIAGVKATRGATRGAMAVLGIALRARANRRDMLLGFVVVDAEDRG